MEQELTFSNSHGIRIKGILSLPDQPTKKIAILCHGFTINKNNSTNQALTKTLLEHNIATFRFDFFGHGESQGKFEDITLTEGIDDATQAIETVKKKDFQKIALFGSSFGGAVAIATATESEDIDLLCLKAPVIDWPSRWQSKLGEQGMKQWQETGSTTYQGKDGPLKLNYTLYQDLLEYDLFAFAKQIKIPVMIVHGDNDQSVPLQQASEFIDFLQCKNCLEVIEGADHYFSDENDFNKMIQLITDFIKEKL